MKKMLGYITVGLVLASCAQQMAPEENAVFSKAVPQEIQRVLNTSENQQLQDYLQQNHIGLHLEQASKVINKDYTIWTVPTNRAGEQLKLIMKGSQAISSALFSFKGEQVNIKDFLNNVQIEGQMNTGSQQYVEVASKQLYTKPVSVLQGLQPLAATRQCTGSVPSDLISARNNALTRLADETSKLSVALLSLATTSNALSKCLAGGIGTCAALLIAEGLAAAAVDYQRSMVSIASSNVSIAQNNIDLWKLNYARSNNCSW